MRSVGRLDLAPTMAETNCLSELDFDSLSMSTEEACELVYKMLQSVHASEHLHVTDAAIREFARQVPNYYNTVPFHCFQHAVMVAQMAYLVLTRGGLSDVISERKSVSLLLAALCHDMQHPGLSNDYLVRTGHEYAKEHDVSPLENHHAACAHKLVGDGVTEMLSGDERAQLLRDIEEFILATDLSQHGSIMKEVHAITPVFDTSNQDHMRLLCKLVLKCADVSNECRPPAVAARWLSKLNTEFWAQGDQEKSEGVVPKPMMDREQADINRQQIGFLSHLVVPMFSALYKILPRFKDLTEGPVDNALKNFELALHSCPQTT